MKIKRSELERIVKEELAYYLQGLLEAKPAKAGLEDADQGAGEEEKKTAASGVKKTPPADPGDTAGAEDEKDTKQPLPAKAAPKGKLPAEDEPEDDAIEKDVANPGEDQGEEEDAEDVTGGNIAKEITGKTVQSITMDPKSKIMPGAQEIVVTFDQTPDPLRILINKSGVTKFYWKGLHNEL